MAAQAISDFFFTEPMREYGYSLNEGEGVGSLLMMGARVAKARVVHALNQDDPLSKVAGVCLGLAIGILSAPITLLGAAIYGISSLVPHKFKEVDDSVFPRTSPAIVDQVYSLTKELKEIAKKHDFVFWATGGTLLGAVRHKGMIPWDDDGDYAMKIADLDKLLSAKDDLQALGIDLIKGPLGLYKLKYTDEKRKELFDGTDEVADLDIVLCIDDGNGRWISSDPVYRDLYPQEVFLNDDILELEDVQFGPNGLTVPIPQNSEAFLKKCYGDDSLQYGVQTHTHGGFFGLKIGELQFNPVLTKQKVKITGDFARGNIWK